MSKELFTGIAVICLAIVACALVPIAGMIGSALIPVPVIVYRCKLGRQAALLITAAGLLCTALLGDGIEVVFFGELLLIGGIMGELLLRRWPLERLMGAVCTAVGVVALSALLISGIASGKGPLTTLSEAVRAHLQVSLELYRQMGLPKDQLDFLQASIDVIRQVLIGVMPGLLVSSTLMVCWISLLAARRLLQLQRLAFPSYPPLDHWKAPEPWVWGVIAAGGLMLVPNLTAKTIGLNGLVIFMVVYFFQGMAVVAYFFHRKQIPRLAQMLLYGLILVQQIVMLAVIALGFFDTWFNFRKLGKPLASA